MTRLRCGGIRKRKLNRKLDSKATESVAATPEERLERQQLLRVTAVACSEGKTAKSLLAISR